jgi:hypothetical protein
VQVVGRFDEFGRSVILSNCDFTELSPSTVTRISAKELTAAYAKDPEGAAKKYEGKEVIVEGEVVDLGTTPGANSATLAGEEGWRVGCAIRIPFGAAAGELKKGAQARIRGNVGSAADKRVSLDTGFPLRSK